MLSKVEHEQCLPSLWNLGISPGGRAAAEGCLCLPSAPTPGIAIKNSYGLELARFVVLGAAGHGLLGFREDKEILLVLVMNL